MLKIHKLSNKILKQISFEINLWETIGLIWPNWSGKSSLAKTIIGLNKTEKGNIFFKNKDITKSNPSERSQNWLCYIFQNIPSYQKIKIKDYFEIFVKEIQTDLFNTFWLDRNDYKERFFDESLSWGEKKKLEIILNFMLDKDFYILDEIETNLDQSSRTELINIIKQFKKKWKTFLIISHDEKVQSLSEKSILLCNWHIKMIEETSKVLEYDKNKCPTCEEK